MRGVILTILFINLAGCSTTALRTGHERTIPAEHIFITEYTHPKPNHVSVMFTRDSGLLGSGCSAAVFINKDKAFKLDHSQSLTIYLPPGNHFFSAGMNGGLCGSDIKSDSVTLDPGRGIEYRISMSISNVLTLTRVK